MERRTDIMESTRRTMMLSSIWLMGSMLARFAFRPSESEALGFEPKPNWRERGVKIIPGSQLDFNTPQTAGMTRAAAITHARTGASKIWAGTVAVQATAKTGAHHHGELESILYVTSGRGRVRWGEHLSSSLKGCRATSFTFPHLFRTKRLIRATLKF